MHLPSYNFFRSENKALHITLRKYKGKNPKNKKWKELLKMKISGLNKSQLNLSKTTGTFLGGDLKFYLKTKTKHQILKKVILRI